MSNPVKRCSPMVFRTFTGSGTSPPDHCLARTGCGSPPHSFLELLRGVSLRNEALSTGNRKPWERLATRVYWLVPPVGLEPTLFWNSILSRARLPFRHDGTWSERIKRQEGRRVKNFLWNMVSCWKNGGIFLRIPSVMFPDGNKC